jgi:hypothetical protein
MTSGSAAAVIVRMFPLQSFDSLLKKVLSMGI